MLNLCITVSIHPAQVDPATGAVVGWLRASDLHPRAMAAAKADADAAAASGKPAPVALNGGPEVLNGIAYDADSGRLWITGGRWGHDVARVARG